MLIICTLLFGFLVIICGTIGLALGLSKENNKEIKK